MDLGKKLYDPPSHVSRQNMIFANVSSYSFTEATKGQKTLSEVSSKNMILTLRDHLKSRVFLYNIFSNNVFLFKTKLVKTEKTHFDFNYVSYFDSIYMLCFQ